MYILGRARINHILSERQYCFFLLNETCLCWQCTVDLNDILDRIAGGQLSYSLVTCYLQFIGSTVVFAVLELWIRVLYARTLVALSLIHRYHRLRGSASPVLTAIHHSYGSPKLSDFFPAHPWRSDRPTGFDAKWLKRRAFTQGCAFCSKNRNFSYPMISKAPKRSKFRKFLDLKIFARFGLAFNFRGSERENTLYSSSEPNKSGILKGKVGVRNWNMY